MAYRRYDSTVVATAPLVDADTFRAPSERTSMAASSASPLDIAHEKYASRGLPTWFAYPMSIIMSPALSAGLYSFVPDMMGAPLAAVSRSLNEPWQIGGLLAWRLLEITIGWSFGLDHFDFVQLTAMANMPYYTLLYLFFGVSFEPLALALVIDMFSLWFPFWLLRPTNYHNNLRSVTTPGTTKDLAVDKTIQFYMSLFAASIYGTVVYLSLWSWLPVFLINNFEEILTLEFAHNAVFPVVFAACLPIGWAAKDFLFSTSIVYARATPAELVQFDPKTATLGETFMYNAGVTQFSSREGILGKRTFLLVAFTAAHSFIKVFGTVEGATIEGAAGWAALWSVAAAATGLGFLYVGDA
ncbi:hypothetical protein D6D01_00469 [Aureobasidium pullulans]|uniref:Uncharacterized protein n=1 Tax=Aureobasidium pullulans TaxID=5580 RepID=A0A4S9M2Q1_AURPU|nr:hypothetical protein D6D01_00469 [Aureobasidium pullulans]